MPVTNPTPTPTLGVEDWAKLLPIENHCYQTLEERVSVHVIVYLLLDTKPGTQQVLIKHLTA